MKMEEREKDEFVAAGAKAKAAECAQRRDQVLLRGSTESEGLLCSHLYYVLKFANQVKVTILPPSSPTSSGAIGGSGCEFTPSGATGARSGCSRY